NFTLHGAESRGPSMNKRYPEKSAIIYTDIIETGESPKPGRRYIVEIERADGLRESTVKLLWRDDSGQLWLLPESNDPRYQSPIALNGNEGDTIRIVGRVTHSVQRED
ncbi:MAG: phage repressor, partial [Stutzerimonas stutzeri]